VIEVTLPVPADQVDALDEFLLEFGEPRWMLTQDLPTASAKLVGVFETRVEADSAFSMLRAADARFATGGAVFKELADADWRDSYKAHFKAWNFGSLHWVPVWEREKFALPAGHQVIWLDPGLAFGTGNHETTRLCCERLVALAREHGTARSVVDAGCGSGILALSAAALGFREVVGFATDPVAVQISAENAVANELSSRVAFYEDDLISGLANRRADIVLANIQADVLMRFAHALLNAVNPGGSLVLSGILARENEQVRDVFQKAAKGWTCEFRILGEWSDVLIGRPFSISAR
jgi:ribosomal protein L11 methyltransferase